jgi:alpha-glucuronidase
MSEDWRPGSATTAPLAAGHRADPLSPFKKVRFCAKFRSGSKLWQNLRSNFLSGAAGVPGMFSRRRGQQFSERFRRVGAARAEKYVNDFPT